ncbi:MAG: benzylsuccinate CoA-transferase BbsF subunit [Chloroflexi bacterium]|jgi:benzylsuccinate CoA-transferase BbsF subunit|nr:MAG: benzylsuccinate CoA-transferase BbsF subunit [Chloroflexota bacterium]
MLPLQGIRVLDFGWVMAAPITAHLMADMGAEVIKVESRTHLDAARRGRPLVSGETSDGDLGNEPDLVPLFHSLNRGKLSITVDLTHPRAWEAIRPLVAKTDVIVHNLTPRASRNLGLTYERLAALREDIIVVSLTAAGQYGPLSDISGYAPSVSSLAGLEGLVGYDGEDPIGMLGLNFSDPNAGMLGYLAAVAALWHRKRTGQGQHVDLSQMEGVAQYLGEPFMEYSMNGSVPSPKGPYHPRMSPYGNFPTSEPDRWVAIAIDDDLDWQAFGKVIGESWVEDERFASREGRMAHRGELNQFVAAWTGPRTVDEIVLPLQHANVAAMPVMSIEDQFADPQHQAREVYVNVEHPKVGSEPIHGLAWKMSDTPGQVDRPAPLLGEHNRYVLEDLLGFTTHQVQDFQDAGVLE